MKFIEFVLNQYKIIGTIISLLLISHILFGKPRWQLYPIYVLTFLYLILILINNFKNINISPIMAKFIVILTISLSLISIVLIIVLPLEKIPKASGKFSIGTRSYDLTDKSRKAVYSSELSDNRKIKFQVWYPTDNVKGYERTKWIDDGRVLTRQLARNMRMPSFGLDHTAIIESNSFKDAEISKKLTNYPIVIISHGWIGFRELHTDFAEELASNGYIAISIDHTYGSQAVKFNDGDIAYLQPTAISNSNKLVTTYGEDVGSVLNQLEKLNKDGEFKDKLDLENIGLLGHSTGGGGDVYISLKDNRVKAVLGLDAWVEPIDPKDLKVGLSIPSLFIRSETWALGPNNINLQTIINNSSDSKLVQIDKSTHVDFSMAYMYSPLTKLVGFTGRLKGRQASEIQRQFIIGFFNKNLKENENYNDSYIEEIKDKYEEVKIIEKVR